MTRHTQALTSQQSRHRGLGISWLLDPPARRQIIERAAEANIARSRNGWRNIKNSPQLARQGIGSVMTAKERYNGRTIFSDRDNRRLLMFIREGRRDRTDQDSGRTYPDNRHAGIKKSGDMACRAINLDVTAQTGKGMNTPLPHRVLKPTCERHGSRRQHDKGRRRQRKGHQDSSPAHGSSRLWTRIMEK